MGISSSSAITMALKRLMRHNSRNLVKVNDVVKSWRSDRTGRTYRTATTEHLHFEFRVASQALNPNLLINTENRTLQHHTLYLYNRGGTVKASTQPLDASTLASEQRTEENASSVSINSSTATSSNKSAHNASKAVYHRIRKGETLSHLARKYSTTVAKICRLNNIKPTTAAAAFGLSLIISSSPTLFAIIKYAGILLSALDGLRILARIL